MSDEEITLGDYDLTGALALLMVPMAPLILLGWVLVKTGWVDQPHKVAWYM